MYCRCSWRVRSRFLVLCLPGFGEWFLRYGLVEQIVARDALLYAEVVRFLFQINSIPFCTGDSMH
jgi:hypothetical protein